MRNGAGDEARTRNFQLGNLNFRSFIFNTYKIAQKKCVCMRCIPCMRCLICVSLGDVWGTVLRYDSVLFSLLNDSQLAPIRGMRRTVRVRFIQWYNDFKRIDH